MSLATLEPIAKKIAMESVFDIEGDANAEIFEAYRSDYSALYDHLVETNDTTFVVDGDECVLIAYPHFQMAEDAIELLQAIFNHTVANFSELPVIQNADYSTEFAIAAGKDVVVASLVHNHDRTLTFYRNTDPNETRYLSNRDNIEALLADSNVVVVDDTDITKWKWKVAVNPISVVGYHVSTSGNPEENVKNTAVRHAKNFHTYLHENNLLFDSKESAMIVAKKVAESLQPYLEL